MEIRKKSIVVLLGITIAGLVGASAASLGGITNDSLGADADVVAACDTDGVVASFVNTYDATLQIYEVTGVTISGVAAGCDGLDYQLTLDDGSPLGVEATGTVALTLGSFSVTFAGADAELVDNLAIVISG